MITGDNLNKLYSARLFQLSTNAGFFNEAKASC